MIVTKDELIASTVAQLSSNMQPFFVLNCLCIDVICNMHIVIFLSEINMAFGARLNFIV